MFCFDLNPQDFGFSEDALGQFVSKSRQFQCPAHIELEVTKLEAKGEQTLNCAEATMHRRFFQRLGQTVGKGLQVEQLY